MFTLPFAFMAAPAGGGGFDPDAQAYIDAVIAAGGTLSTPNKDAINTFFVDTKELGVYSKMYRIYPFLGGVGASNAINALSPGTNDITFSGGWTQGASGSQGDGTSGYGNTYFNPYVSASTSNMAYGWYNNLDFFQGGERYHGCLQVVSGEVLWMSVQLSSGRVDWGQDSRIDFSFPSGQKGFFIASSNSSTSPSRVSTYIAETNSYATLRDVTLAAPPLPMFIGALNYLGSSYGYQSLRYGFFFTSSELTQTEMQNFSPIVNALQTAFGRNTY
jgi:hypothetical protein